MNSSPESSTPTSPTGIVSPRRTREDGAVLVTVGHLATIHGLPQRAKLTSRQSESIARTAHHVGLEIEPDARVTNRPYGWDEVVALLRPEESPRLPGDSRYAGASLMLEIGLFVASADGNVGDEEVDHITRFLESQFLLEPPDARRLEALKQVLMNRTPSLNGVGKRLQAVLTVVQREVVGRFLVGIAAANGTIDRKEITALRGAYKALGVDVDLLNRLLDEFHRATREPVEVHRPTAPARPGEVIPPRPGDDGAIELDENLLRRILGETHEVARMLGVAMRELAPEECDPAVEDAPSGPSPRPAPLPRPPATDPRFEGLDPRFHVVLAELLGRPNWSRDDFEALVRRHRLMFSGTMDRINEWSQDRLDDPIIENDGERSDSEHEPDHGAIMTSPSPVKPRERDAILQSLRAGVVPRIGLRHLQVGRRRRGRRGARRPRADRAGRGDRALHHREVRRRQEFLPEPGTHGRPGAEVRRRPGGYHDRPAPARVRRPGPQPLCRTDAEPGDTGPARGRCARQHRRTVDLRPRP